MGSSRGRFANWNTESAWRHVSAHKKKAPNAIAIAGLAKRLTCVTPRREWIVSPLSTALDASPQSSPHRSNEAVAQPVANGDGDLGTFPNANDRTRDLQRSSINVECLDQDSGVGFGIWMPRSKARVETNGRYAV